MVGVGNLDRGVVEELLAPLVPRLAAAIGFVRSIGRVLALLLGVLVVLLQCRLSVGDREAILLRQVCKRLVLLHESSALVVLAVPSDLGRCLGVEAQEEAWGLAKDDALVLPHHASDVVASAQLIAEPVAIGIQEHATNTAQSLSSQELDLCIWILRVDKTSGVDLHPLKVNGVRTDCHCHLQTIASAVLTIGGWQVCQVWSVLVQQ
mmetsp:Transcript_14014/g.33060  ORF Transcript_14014/g.33060 Transcript_14014/m.33060 type:complete len:207 (-) Transcript_14014:673-1293(-)